MTITADSFRAQFPAFANTATFPDAQVNFYIGFAGTMLIADRWGGALDQGTSLFVAHFLTLDRIATSGVSPGGKGAIAGTAVGAITGGSVDKVSYTRDVQSVMETNAGHWGMSIYGNIYLRLARMMGAGPVQVGVPAPGDMGLYNGAWPGPNIGPW